MAVWPQETLWFLSVCKDLTGREGGEKGRLLFSLGGGRDPPGTDTVLTLNQFLTDQDRQKDGLHIYSPLPRGLERVYYLFPLLASLYL